MEKVDARDWARRSLVAVMVFLGLVYTVSALVAVANHAWRWPMFDQYRLYAFYLGMPFPENVLQLENGHRPVVPALLRVAEAWCCSANQLVQISVGTILASAAVAFMAWLAWNARPVATVARTTAMVSFPIGLFWLGNARILMHGNESVHAYLVVVSVMLACWLTVRAVHRDSSASLWLASLCCCVAMFSFGPGVAAFAAVLMLIPLLGGRWVWCAIPGAVLAAALYVYVFALPGDAGVRHQIILDPLENGALAMQWIASSWINALIATSPGGGLPALDGVRQLASLLGLAGSLAWVLLGVRLAIRRGATLPVEAVAFGTAGFALATAALVGIARYAYFQQHPDQIFADRYLLWPNVFWAALFVLTIFAVHSFRSPLLRSMPAALLVLAAVALWPTHRAWAGWASEVRRQSELVAIASWTGVRDNVMPDAAAASPEHVEAALRLMREQSLGVFAHPPPFYPGDMAPRGQDAGCPAARIVEFWDDSGTGQRVARVSGSCTPGSGVRPEWLTIVDGNSVVRGLGRWSRSADGSALSLHMRTMDGFDGLIVGYRPDAEYSILVGAREVRVDRR